MTDAGEQTGWAGVLGEISPRDKNANTEQLAEFIRLLLKRQQRRNDRFMMAILAGFLALAATTLWLALRLQPAEGPSYSSAVDNPVAERVFVMPAIKTVTPYPAESHENIAHNAPTGSVAVDRSPDAERIEIASLVETRHRLEALIAAQQAEWERLQAQSRREQQRMRNARRLLDDLQAEQAAFAAAGRVQPAAVKTDPVVANDDQRRLMEKRIRARLAWEQLEKSPPEAFPEDTDE